MVTVPSSPARLNSGPANVYLPTGIARTGAEETGQGLIRAGALLAQVAERQQAWEEKQQQARDAVEAIKAQTAATRTLNDAAYAIEREGDWRTGVQRFDQAAQGLAQLGANIKDPVARARLDAHVQGLTESRRASLRSSLFKLEADDAVASLDESLETLSQAAANAPNRAERERHQAAAANAIKSMADAGFIDRSKAVNLWQAFKGKEAKVEVDQIIMRDPERAEALLADPRNFPALDPQQRIAAQNRAAGLVDRIEKRRNAAEEKAEARAEKMLKKQGEIMAKELWSLHNVDPTQSRLNPDIVERAKPFLAVDEYKALRRAATGQDFETKDQPAAVADLTPKLDQPDAAALIDRAYLNQQLSTPTYLQLRNRALTLRADDQPASPYKSGRQYLNQALDPGQLGNDPFVRQALALAREQALADFDTWAETNRGADRPTAVAQADALFRQYQNVAFDKMRLALPRPEGYTGSKQDVRQEHVDAARKAIFQKLDSKLLSEAQAAQQLQQLETWEQIIAPKPTAKTPAPRSGAKGAQQ